jgi:hypothetical protein
MTWSVSNGTGQFIRNEEKTMRNRRTLHFFLGSQNLNAIGTNTVLYVFGPLGSGSIGHKYGSCAKSFHHQANIVGKTLISVFLRLLYDFSQGFRIRILRSRIFLGLPDQHPDPLDRGTYGSEDPDPYKNATEPQH